jgi:transposase
MLNVLILYYQVGSRKYIFQEHVLEYYKGKMVIELIHLFLKNPYFGTMSYRCKEVSVLWELTCWVL